MEKEQNGELIVQSAEFEPSLISNTTIIKSSGIKPETDAELRSEFILRSPSEQTRRSYRTTLDVFDKFWEARHGRAINFSEVSFADVREWRDSMIKANRRAHTICNKLAGLRSLFGYGVALGIFKINPASAKLVPPPEKPKNSPGRALSATEVKYLLSWFRLDSLDGSRDYAIILLMLRLSLRVSEVCGLKNSSIKSTGGRWVLTAVVKGGREVKRPLPSEVKKAIDVYLKIDRSDRETLKSDGANGFLFQSTSSHRYVGKNTALTTRHVWHLVKKYADLTGIGDVTPHDLRRTAITKAFKLQIPIHHIQRMSGHQDLNTLRLYDIDRENLEDNAINQLNYDSD